MPNNNITKVQVQKLPALSEINTVKNIYKNSITTVPNIIKSNPTALPYLKKSDILNAQRKTYRPNSDWQKVLDKAGRTVNRNDFSQINSYADIIYGGLFRTVYNGGPVEQWLEKHGIAVDKIPALNIIPRLMDYTWQYNLQPLIHGEFGTLVKNGFQNFAESADFLANPVKGFLIGTFEGGLDQGFENVGKAVGIGEGRTNYDYDTDNKALDFALEIVSDPGVWASFGMPSLFQGLTKFGREGVERVATTLAKGPMKEIAEELGEVGFKKYTKRIVKEAVNAGMKGKPVDLTEISEWLVKYTKTPGITTNSALKNISKETLQKVSLDAVQDVATELVKLSKEASEKMALRIIGTVDTIDNIAAVSTIAPYTVLPYKTIKKLSQIHTSRIQRTLEPFKREGQQVSAIVYADVMAKVDDVSDSLVKVANEQGFKGLNNSAVRKAFYGSVNEDINTIQSTFKKLSELLNKSEDVLADVNKTEDTLKQFFVNKHGLSADLSLSEMLDQYKQALERIASEDEIFKSRIEMVNKLQDTWVKLDELNYTKIELYNTLGIDTAIKKETLTEFIDGIKQLDYAKLFDDFYKEADTFLEHKILAKLQEATYKSGKYIGDPDFLRTFSLTNETEANALLDLITDGSEVLKAKIKAEPTLLKKYIDDYLQHYYDAFENMLTERVIMHILQPLIKAGTLPSNFNLKNFSDAFKKFKKLDAAVALAEVSGLKVSVEMHYKLDIYNDFFEYIDYLRKMVPTLESSKISEIADVKTSLINRTKTFIEKLINRTTNAIKIIDDPQPLESTFGKTLKFNNYQKGLPELIKRHSKYFEKTIETTIDLDKAIGFQDELRALAEELKNGFTFDSDFITFTDNGALAVLHQNIEDCITHLNDIIKADGTFDGVVVDNVVRTLQDSVNSFKDSVRKAELTKGEKPRVIQDVNELYNSIESLADRLSENLNYKEAVIDAAGNVVIYTLKQNQSLSDRVYINDPEVFKFINDLFNVEGTVPEDFAMFANKANAQSLAEQTIKQTLKTWYPKGIEGKAIDDLSQDEIINLIKGTDLENLRAEYAQKAEAVDLIRRGADSTISVAELDNNIANSTLTDEIKQTFIDVLSGIGMRHMTVDTVVKNKNTFFDTILTEMKNYINGKRKSESYKLDDYRETIKGFFEDLLGVDTDTWKAMAHHSAADVLTNEQFIKDKLSDVIPDFKNSILFDTETAGLEKEINELYEISFRIDGKTYTFKRHLDETKIANTGSAPTSGAVGLYSKEEFYKYYNRNYAGPECADTIEVFDSEADLLGAIFNFLHKHLNADGSTKLIGHNIEGFDLDFLKKRADKNGMLNTYIDLVNNRASIIDTYVEARKKGNWFEFTKAEEDQIKLLLEPYLIRRTAVDATTGKLWHSGENIINAIPPELSYGLREMASLDSTKASVMQHARKKGMQGSLEKIFPDAIKAQTYDGLAVENTGVFYEKLYKQLSELRVNNIRQINKGLNEVVFDNTLFENPAFIKDLAEFLKQTVDKFKDQTIEQIESHLKYLNGSKMLYGFVDELFNYLGYKKIVDTSALRNWFGNTDLSSLGLSVSENMYKMARVLDNRVSYIKNVKAIEPYADDLTEFIQLIARENIFKNSHNFGLKYFTTNLDNLAEKYVLSEYLMGALSREGFYYKLSDKHKELFSRVEECIKAKPYHTHATVADTGKTYIQLVNDTIERFEWTQDSRALEGILADLEKGLEDFNLARAFDKAKIFEPEVQAKIFNSRKIYAFIKEFINICKIAEKESPAALAEINAVMHNLTEELSVATMRNVLKYNSAEELVQRIAWNGGLITFPTNDATVDLFRKIQADENTFKELGVKLFYDSDRAWLTIDRNVMDYSCDILKVDDVSTKHVYLNKKGMPKVEIEAPQYAELDIPSIADVVKKRFDKPVTMPNEVPRINNYLANDVWYSLVNKLADARAGLAELTNGASIGMQADVLNKTNVRYIVEHAPKEVQDAFGDIDDFLDHSGLFSGTFLNLMNLGDTVSKRAFQETVPGHIITSFAATTRYALEVQDSKLKYLNAMFNNAMRLDVGQWADTANDTVIIKHLKNHPELKVVALVKDSKVKQGFNIRQIKINNVKDLQQARRLGASIVTADMHSRATDVLFSSVFDNGVLKVFGQFMRLYKAGMLSPYLNPGSFMRNALDSTIKEMINNESIIETGKDMRNARKLLKGYDKALYQLMAMQNLNTEAIERISKAYGVSPEEILKDINFEVATYKNNQLKDFINASNLYLKYNTALDEIIKTDSNAVLRPQNVDFYFKYMSKDLDKETFYFVHRFITQGASAGQTKALQQLYNNMDNASVVERVMHTYNHLLNKLAGPNQTLEQIVRLSQHMNQTRKGMSFAESTAQIAKVHFDYADKTDVTKLIELAIPFYSFKMKNFNYWADLIETKPWVMKMFSEFYEQVWDFDEYDTYAEHLELANNASLEYQILSGNIPLNDLGLTLKVNPSFMDAMQITSDPFGTTVNSLFAPFGAGFKLAMYALYKKEMLNEFTVNALGFYPEMGPVDMKTTLLNNIPIVGPLMQRAGLKDKYAERLNTMGKRLGVDSSISETLVRALPSMFGATSRWNLENIKEPGSYKKYYNNYRKKFYSKKTYARKSYAKKTYAKKSYVKKNYGNTIYMKYNDVYNKYMDYYNKPYNRYKEHKLVQKSKAIRPPRITNIYWKYYTKSGKRRMDILNAKATQKNLQMKIKLMHDYYR